MFYYSIIAFIFRVCNYFLFYLAFQLASQTHYKAKTNINAVSFELGKGIGIILRFEMIAE